MFRSYPLEGVRIRTHFFRQHEFGFPYEGVAMGVQGQKKGQQIAALKRLLQPRELPVQVGAYESPDVLSHHLDDLCEKGFLAFEIGIEGAHSQPGAARYVVDVHFVVAPFPEQALARL
jgi:hypothetical protein